MNKNPPLDQMLQKVIPHQSKNATLPPIWDWNPPFKGDMDMIIAADGHWHHEGSPINRDALVNLFASILKREEDGCYYLVTPTEKFRIQVDDAPFTVIDLEVTGTGKSQQLVFITNVGDRVLAGKDFPITVKTDDKGSPRPYILVRQNLMALIGRNIFYQLVGMGEELEKNGQRLLGVWCAGELFELGELEDTD